MNIKNERQRILAQELGAGNRGNMGKTEKESPINLKGLLVAFGVLSFCVTALLLRDFRPQVPASAAQMVVEHVRGLDEHAKATNALRELTDAIAKQNQEVNELLQKGQQKLLIEPVHHAPPAVESSLQKVVTERSKEVEIPKEVVKKEEPSASRTPKPSASSSPTKEVAPPSPVAVAPAPVEVAAAPAGSSGAELEEYMKISEALIRAMPIFQNNVFDIPEATKSALDPQAVLPWSRGKKGEIYHLTDDYFVPEIDSYQWDWGVRNPISAELQAVVQRFARRQKAFLEGKLPGEAKFLVWRCRDRSGYGNRITGLTSAFAMALLTDRIFVIDAHQYFHGLFGDPISSWTIENMIKDPVLVKQLQKEEEENEEELEISHRHMMWINTYTEKGTVEQIRTIHTLRCDDPNFGYQHRQFVVLKSNQYFMPIFYMNKHFRPTLEKLFPDYDIFGPLQRYLFHPSDKVWSKTMSYYNKYLKDRRSVGLQIRIFGKTTNTTLFQEQISTFSECVDREGGNDQKTMLFVSSLSTDARKYFEDKYGKENVFYTTSDGLVSECLGCDNEDRWISDAVDNLLLSMTTDTFVSPASTFGYTAFTRVSRDPLLVLMDLKMNYAGGKKYYIRAPREDGHCHRETKMLCFHTPWHQFEKPCKGDKDMSNYGFHIETCKDFELGHIMVLDK